MNKKFEQTSFSRNPDNCKAVEVADIGEVVTGTTPSTKIREYWGEGYPFVTPTDFSSSKYVYKTERSVTPQGVRVARLIPKDTVMVTCIASVGEVSMASQECITNQQINSIICKKGIDPHYIYYTILFKKRILKSWAGITTSLIIKKSLFEKFPIPLPPLPEQQKIAEILGTVDEAIEKVDKAIEKTQRLKKGLMQELLTKGIGHKEFKDTKIGRIPKEWEVEKLGNKNIIDLIMGQSPPSLTYNKNGEGLPFLQGKAEFGEIVPEPRSYCSKPIKIAELNDILLSVRAPVGDVNIAPCKCCIGRGLTAIRPSSDRLHYLYLFYYLIFNKRIFKSLSTGSTFKAIRRNEIENYLISVPSLREQKKIVEILGSVDNCLELLKEKKQKFGKIKKGLMNDLLTGRKRVSI